MCYIRFCWCVSCDESFQSEKTSKYHNQIVLTYIMFITQSIETSGNSVWSCYLITTLQRCTNQNFKLKLKKSLTKLFSNINTKIYRSLPLRRSTKHSFFKLTSWTLLFKTCERNLSSATVLNPQNGVRSICWVFADIFESKSIY